MKELVGKMLGLEVKEVEINEDLQIIEDSAIYNQEDTISIEKLSDDLTFYVTVKVDGYWEFEGYYQEV